MRTTEIIPAIRNLLGSAWISLFLGGHPVPASRPRVYRHGAGYSKTYSKWRRDVWRYVAEPTQLPTDRPLVVLIETVVERPRTSKLSAPKPDVDNYAKGPLDILTKSPGFWRDDSQVVFLGVLKRWADPGEEPGFHVFYMEHDHGPSLTTSAD